MNLVKDLILSMTLTLFVCMNAFYLFRLIKSYNIYYGTKNGNPHNLLAGQTRPQLFGRGMKTSVWMTPTQLLAEILFLDFLIP